MKLKKSDTFRRMRHIVEDVGETVQDDWDFTIAVTGKKRKGKSTFMFSFSTYLAEQVDSRVWLCYSYGLSVDDNTEEKQVKKRRKQLNLENTRYYPARMKYALKHSSQYDIIFADESINFLYSGDWNTQEARDFIRRHDRYGYKDLTIALLMPSFLNMNKGFRIDRIDSHIWIRKRGLAWVYPMIDTPMGIQRGDHVPVAFPKLSGEMEQLYRRIKNYMVDDIDQDEDEETIKDWKIKMNKRLKEFAEEHGYTRLGYVKERSQLLDVATGTISKWDNS